MRRSTQFVIIFLFLSSQIFALPQQVVKKKIIRQTPQTGIEEQYKQIVNVILTDAQKEQLRVMNTEFAKKRILLTADLKIARIELEEALQKDEAKKDIDLKVKKVNDLRDQLFALNIDERLEFRKMLTPDQKAKLKNLLENTPFGRGVRTPGMSPYRPMMDSCPSDIEECDEDAGMMDEEHE
ncbi:MAG: hypothetical protein PHW79_10150 [Candidatus Marinimicrobia bacterium]|nr:hypothetical protein [Candidatus Neomarinimicrobiota bacterium]